MRIGLVSQEYPPGYVGGIGTQCRAKGRGLAALAHDVEVLTAGEESGPLLAVRDDGGVPVHELRAPGRGLLVNRTETYWIGYTWAVLAALRSLERRRAFDVIDFPDYAAEGLAYQLDRPENDSTAVVVHLHGSLGTLSEQIGWPEPGDPLLRVGAFMEGLSIERADGLIAASQSIAELTASRLAIPLERIEVVGGAVDADVFSPAPSLRRGDDELRLLFVGNVAANKGVSTVLEAFICLHRRYPGLSLTIAGTAEEDAAEELRARAIEAGVIDRLTLLGFVEHAELPELYRSADVLAAPSHYEGGLGMVYLEAMACGLPVVAHAAGGAVEAIAPGETGILLERAETQEATAAIDALLADPSLRARMGAAGRRRVEENFTIERYAARVAEAYERAIDRRRASVVAW
jgi:glycosyltransferase involved in cell wall biosynthesis